MNKRYYWFKLKDDFFNSDDIKIILTKKNGSDYVIFWQKLLLKAITSKEVGILRYKENIPYSPEILATVTDTNIDIVKGAMEIFLKLEMIELSEKGDIIIDELIQELIGSETDVAKRVRKHRKKKMLHGNKKKQIGNTEIESESELESKKHKEKKKYKNNVTLTEKEYKNLIKKYSEKDTLRLIEKLSSYKLAHGRKYKSDFGAINQWVVGALKLTPILNPEETKKNDKDLEFTFVQDMICELQEKGINEYNKYMDRKYYFSLSEEQQIKIFRELRDKTE